MKVNNTSFLYLVLENFQDQKGELFISTTLLNSTLSFFVVISMINIQIILLWFFLKSGCKSSAMETV